MAAMMTYGRLAILASTTVPVLYQIGYGNMIPTVLYELYSSAIIYRYDMQHDVQQDVYKFITETQPQPYTVWPYVICHVRVAIGQQI